jgi:hypothetical protein
LQTLLQHAMSEEDAARSDSDGSLGRRGCPSSNGRSGLSEWGRVRRRRGKRGVQDKLTERDTDTGCQKQKKLTIFRAATGAGSSLYFRGLSGTRDWDIVVMTALERSQVAGVARPGRGRRGCSSVG